MNPEYLNLYCLNLYSAKQTRELDRLAIDEAGITGYSLMKKAGASAFHAIMSAWPDTKTLTILCGTGNNGGDGYVIAKLAKIRGIEIKLIQVGDLSKQGGDAFIARQDFEAEGISGELYNDQDLSDEKVIVDALLGTGLQRDVSNEWKNIIDEINAAAAKVISIDIPSGLNTDTGLVQGVAVTADLTITFIGRKQGMYTASGSAKSGVIKFDSLSIPDSVYKKVEPSSHGLTPKLSLSVLKPRNKNSHKGTYGHVLLIGGSPGMNGAILLSAIAALRTGCGLVTVLTHPVHAAFLNINQPEIMCRGIANTCELEQYLSAADAVVIGPGLGTDQWGKDLLNAVITTDKPLVIDADGLNNLPNVKSKNNNWVLTPHPGEAASLLKCSVSDIQQDRFLAAKKISEKYNAVCVLKGSGTIIHDSQNAYVCSSGNPGMAVAGMGDVLSGILGTLIAQAMLQAEQRAMQQVPFTEMVNNAVVLHAMAGDKVADSFGEKGMLASDLFPAIRCIVNGG